MDQILSSLSKEAITELKDAHAYITILIAGADGHIDKNELEWAEKIVQIRTFTGDEHFKDFHDEVNAELPGKISELLAALPADPKVRGELIAQKLKDLNPILASLEPSHGEYLYKGYTSLALRIARSSGGIFSFFSIGAEESKWVNLAMIDPIHYDPDAEA